MQVLIVGKKGTGKTLLAKQMIANKPNIIIMDQMNQFQDYDLIDDIDEAENRIIKNQFNFRVNFDDEETLEQWYSLLLNYTGINLVIDEIALFVPKRKEKSLMFKLLTGQRYNYLNFICTTQRISEVSTKFFSQLDILITFKQVYINDLDVLQKYDFDLETVKNLPIIKNPPFFDGSEYITKIL